MSKCLICGGDQKYLFSSNNPANDGPSKYDVNWCANCEFGRLGGDFTPAQVARFYEGDYYTHGATRPVDQLTFLDRLRIHLAWRADSGKDFTPAELPSYQTVCDIGCGDGRHLRQFKALGYRTFGVDPDPVARAQAARTGTIFDGTAESLPPDLAHTKFDVVLVSHVLEHCIDPRLTIENAKRLLAPGGTLVVEVPNNSALGFTDFKSAWPWSDIPRHLSFFTEDSLIKLLEEYDLVSVKSFYVGYVRQFFRSWLDNQRTSELDAWRFLAKTAFLAPKLKYDSIRIHAKPG